MSGETIANLAYVTAVLTLAGLLCWWICNDEPDEGADEPGLTVWDDTTQRWTVLPPGVQPSLSQYTPTDVDALDRLVLAWDAPAFDPATDPQWAAARARLVADLNDTRGEQP